MFQVKTTKIRPKIELQPQVDVDEFFKKKKLSKDKLNKNVLVRFFKQQPKNLKLKPYVFFC